MPSPIPSPTTTAIHAAMDIRIRASILVAVVTVHALLLMWLGSRRRCSSHPVLRFVLWSLSAAYLPLMSYVLSYMTTKLWSLERIDQIWLLVSLVLVQSFLKAKADMKALAVAAVASTVAGDDEINSLKVRPSTDSLIYSFWVAGLVIYQIRSGDEGLLEFQILFISPLWALGTCRMVLEFVAFHWANRSFALGRNVQFMDGYMAQLQEASRGFMAAEGQLPAAVPHLIVTGERKGHIEESPLGYRVKRSALEDEPSSLVTLDRVWLESETLLVPQLKDLCLSFALFKCLRRRFAGYQLAEAGSMWAFRFVRDGLLGREDDHERIFRVIAGELTFASDLYYSPLPVASLGTLYGCFHFLLSVLIFISLCVLIYLILPGAFMERFFLAMLPGLLGVVIAWTEMSEMIASVRSNWTKISIVGHYMRSRSRCARRIFSRLLGRCKVPKQWKDEIGQIDLLGKQSWAHSFKQLVAPMRSRHKTLTVPSEVKAAILGDFRSSGGQLSAGTAAVQRWRHAFCHDITWACIGGDVTTTDAILVRCIATGLFEKRCSSRKAPLSSEQATNMCVAVSLSRYGTYLVSEAPELLPDNSAWTKRRYQAVKDNIDAVLRSYSGADLETAIYGHLVDCFGSEHSHEVLKKGSRLGKQLVAEAEEQGSGEEEAGAEGEDKVWKLLAEFWSEMMLYLAPSDNIKGHIQGLQHGGELITLLWVLLLHAGITSRPAPHDPEP